MPEMNGWQAGTQIRRGVPIGAHVRIVVMTAAAMSENRDRSRLRLFDLPVFGQQDP
jgi:CheY-like chemotaxis protein